MLWIDRELQHKHQELKNVTEEIQATTEELRTLEAELRYRNAQLDRVNNNLTVGDSGAFAPAIASSLLASDKQLPLEAVSSDSAVREAHRPSEVKGGALTQL